MVKNKKMSKTSIAVIVLSILLVLSMLMGLTGAWFTDKVDNGAGKELQFGTVVLNVGASDFGKVTRLYNATGTLAANAKIMPGDKIYYDLDVDGASGSEQFWFAVVVTISGLDSSDVIAETVSGLAADDIKEWTGTAVEVNGYKELDTATYDNKYQGDTVTLTYQVLAIQKANVENAAAALTHIKAAYLQPHDKDASGNAIA